MGQIKAFIAEKNAQVLAHPFETSIVGNEFLLTLVFQNLIENGIKYNQLETPTVEIFYTDTSTHHIIHFKDNGMGIAKRFQDKVFEMFKRLHTNDEIEGTGLGLAICKKIAQNHGGDIVVQSEIGVGSTFILSISPSLSTQSTSSHHLSIVK